MDWRRSVFECMGGIAETVGSNPNGSIPVWGNEGRWKLSKPGDDEGSAPAATLQKPLRTWNDPDLKLERQLVLAVLGNLFPVAYFADKNSVAGGPSASHGGGKWRQMDFWQPSYGGTSCTSANAAVAAILGANGNQWAFHAYEHKTAWVPWGSDPLRPMPRVGDIYLLYRDKVVDPPSVPKKDTDAPHLRHCGFVVHVPKDTTEFWVTADGGQNAVPGQSPSQQAAYLNKRPWEMRMPGDPDHMEKWAKTANALPWTAPKPGIEYPYLGGGAEGSTTNLADANRLLGWLDMDVLGTTFKKKAFDASQDTLRKPLKYTKEDYLDLGAKIDALLKL